MDDDEVRPRWGSVRRADGGQSLVVFHPAEMKDTYRMLDAGTEEPVVMNFGDTFHINGGMLPHQAVLYRMSGRRDEQVGTLSARGRGKGFTVDENKDKKSSMGKALLALFGLGAFVLMMLAGIKGIFWGF